VQAVKNAEEVEAEEVEAEVKVISDGSCIGAQSGLQQFCSGVGKRKCQ